MSRVGKKPVTIPSGVKASVQGNIVQVEGPKGTLKYKLGNGVIATTKDGNVIFSVAQNAGEDPQARANHGTARAYVNNMVKGVTDGWKRSLEMNGVGLGAKLQGTKLVLSVGFSHEVIMEVPKEIKCVLNKNMIELESSNRELVGAFASKIRSVQPPEPYLGKGIKYAEETIRRKAGKTGKK